MTPEEILAKAAEDMGTHGHTKRLFFAPGQDWQTAPSCAYGAMTRTLRRVSGSEAYTCAVDDTELYRLKLAAEKLAKTIVRLHPDHQIVRAWHGVEFDSVDSAYSLITEFNDHDDTTGEDVILAMKTAANDG